VGDEKRIKKWYFKTREKKRKKTFGGTKGGRQLQQIKLRKSKLKGSGQEGSYPKGAFCERATTSKITKMGK